MGSLEAGRRLSMVDFQRDVYCVLGLPMDAVGMEKAIGKVRAAAAQRRPCVLATPNLNFLVGCLADEGFRDSVLRADLSIPDGMPEVWIARLLKLPIKERVPGSDLFDRLANDTSQPLKVYFFGGKPGAAADACRRLNAGKSGSRCVGFEGPGFVPIEAMSSADTIARINASGADLLVVALGAQKGHAWIERNRARILVPVISHLGAVMNFVAGTVRRAPPWMRRNGLEWLWRIKEEPALWRRYGADGLTLLRLLATRVLPHALYARSRVMEASGTDAAITEIPDAESGFVMRLQGEWLQPHLDPLRAAFARAGGSRRNVYLDLAKASSVDAAFVGLAALLHGHLRKAGRRLVLVDPPPSVRRIIRYCCADYLLPAPGMPESRERVRLLNGQFDPLDLHQTVDAIFAGLDAGRRGWLSTVNVAILMMMRSDARLQRYVERSALVVADGQPLVWCAPWLGRPLPERVTGVDLVDALCARAAREGRRIYLLGAHASVVATVAERLRSRHPGLHVGFDDGYFGKDEAPVRAERIRASGTDILLVGMGVPRQETFIEDQWDRLGVGMAIGVGGSFEVLAGLRARAPRWIQAMGMEWFFRLVQEPRRLLPRYVTTNSQFLWLILRELVRRWLAIRRIEVGR